MALSYNKILLALALVEAIALGSAPTRSWSQEKYPSRSIECSWHFRPAVSRRDRRIFAVKRCRRCQHLDRLRSHTATRGSLGGLRHPDGSARQNGEIQSLVNTIAAWSSAGSYQ